jgi:hypothetical protein
MSTPRWGSIRIGWSRHQGYVWIQNPIDNKIYIVQARGLPRWLLNRIESRPNIGSDRTGGRTLRPVLKNG